MTTFLQLYRKMHYHPVSHTSSRRFPSKSTSSLVSHNTVVWLLASFLALLAPTECEEKADTSCYSYPSPPCPRIKPVEKIDYENISGVWWEIYQGSAAEYKCAVFNYEYADGNPPHMTFLADAQWENGTTFKDAIELQSGSSCGKLEADYFHYLEGTSGFIPPNITMFVLYLETDHMIKYGCSTEDGKMHEVFCAKSRPGVKPIGWDKVVEVLKTYGIDESIAKPSRRGC